MLFVLPIAAPAAAQAAVAATVAVATYAYVGGDVLGFRRRNLPPVTVPSLDDLTLTQKKRAMMQGATVPNSQTGNIFPRPPGPESNWLLPLLAKSWNWIQDRYRDAQSLAQRWGLLGGNKKEAAVFDADNPQTWPINPGGRMVYVWFVFRPGEGVLTSLVQSQDRPIKTATGEADGYGRPEAIITATDLNGDGYRLRGLMMDVIRYLESVPLGGGQATQPTITTGSGFFPSKAIPTAVPRPTIQAAAQRPTQPSAPKKSEPVTQPAPAGAPAAPKPYPLIQTPAQAAAVQQIIRVYRLPSATRVTSAGALPAAQPATAAQTSTATRTYGPVTVTTTAPRATLEAIAEEVGRVEKKLGEILNPKTNNQPDWLEKLQGLWDLINALNNYLQAQGASGKYTATSPCVTDQQGNRIVTEIPFAGANDQFGVLRHRIDALAELMQAFKDLRQPICNKTPATNVTVTAYEVAQE